MPVPQERTSIKVQSERAILAAVRLPDSNFDPRDPFGELASLTQQAGGIVVGTLEQRLDRPVAGTYMGTGKVNELAALRETLAATLVVFDHELSPRQIANIEEIVGCKIVDRSELILDIFASRATTNEAKLQVELAQLEYTLPRLRAMWSHLERIVGAGGLAGIGTRGPGEQQLEIDRRLAQKKQLALKARLEDIQHRRRREVAKRNLDHFTVGIVGYTNAGKSTLFNTLTAGGAYADDRLFATLTTRTREWNLTPLPGAEGPGVGSRSGKSKLATNPPVPAGAGLGGVRVMLSDTVGFVRDLPHNLVASFRATLEEATHANLLLIVLDVSDPAAELHFETVNTTLDTLFADVMKTEGDSDEFVPPERIVLLNKIDKLPDNGAVLIWQQRVKRSTGGETIAIVAPDVAHAGHAALRRAVLSRAQGGVIEKRLTLPLNAPRLIADVERRAEVTGRDYSETHVTLSVRVGRRQLDQIKSLASSSSLTIADAETPKNKAPRRAPARAPKPKPTR